MRNRREVQNALEHIRRADPVLGGVIARTNLSALPVKPDYFQALVLSIISQQLSEKAADTIIRRFVALFSGKKFPTPAQVRAMPLVKMRKAGVSRQKISYIKDLARRVDSKKIDLVSLEKLSDEEVIEVLVQVRGIGRWTAEMFLIFALARSDIFSHGDLGLKNAIKKLYNLKAHPSQRKAEKLSAAWRPYRSLACRLLWASLVAQPKKPKGA